MILHTYLFFPQISSRSLICYDSTLPEVTVRNGLALEGPWYHLDNCPTKLHGLDARSLQYWVCPSPISTLVPLGDSRTFKN